MIICLNLPDQNRLKLFCFDVENNFRFRLGEIQLNLDKNTEINKQSQVKFWFNRKKLIAVSYLLSCN